MKKPTITIGIPAYNEEANIEFLLSSLVRQKVKNARIVEIIVISDGSNDSTLIKAKTIQDPRIKVINEKTRRGTSIRQNEILKLSRGDILVLINADTLPANDLFIATLIQPLIREPRIGIAGANVHPAKPRGFFESAIVAGWEFKKYMYDRINVGKNVYNCHGIARAFSRKLYTQLHWPDGLPEDAYSYFSCVQKSFVFSYVPRAQIMFRAPTTLVDHARQSNRFSQGTKSLERYFPKDELNRAYAIPKFLFIKALMTYLFHEPLRFSIYLLSSFYLRLFNRMTINHVTWDISTSSKHIVA